MKDVCFYTRRKKYLHILQYIVLDPDRECARTLGEGTPLWERGGPGPPMGDNERQLSLDRGGEKT
jgi:hypothetical protein